MTNFLNIESQETISCMNFGICNNASRPHSYVDENNQSDWLAYVLNADESEIRFIPVRGCLAPLQGNPIDYCNGILIYPENVIFADLPEKLENNPSWLDDSSSKLKTTISIFRESHNIEDQLKKAYIAYKSPFFVGQSTIINSFAKLGVQLFIDSKIIV